MDDPATATKSFSNSPPRIISETIVAFPKSSHNPPTMHLKHVPIRDRGGARFPGQFGGKAKMDSGFDYAASFSSVS